MDGYIDVEKSAELGKFYIKSKYFLFFQLYLLRYTILICY